LTVVVVKTSSLFFTQLENILQSLEAGEMALVSVNNPSNNELVSATSGQVALQQV
jgi:exonuclease VII small subunit